MCKNWTKLLWTNCVLYYGKIGLFLAIRQLCFKWFIYMLSLYKKKLNFELVKWGGHVLFVLSGMFGRGECEMVLTVSVFNST